MISPRWNGAAVLALILAAACGSAGSAATQGEFVDLGEQITSRTIQGTAFTKDPAGNDLVCTVIRSSAAKLLVFDVHSGKLLHRMALEGGNGGWNATTASDGSVYVGTDNNGHLYRWIPGQDATHDLGQVGPNQTFVWDEAPGVDGEVFVGTYPGCNVIRYHPRDGFRDIGHGAVAPGENYSRSVAYNPATAKIYVGVGSHAHLIELDPKTGEKKNILPAKYADHEFCYTVKIAGGKLFALATNPPEAIVMDPATHEVEATLPGVSPQMVVSPKSPMDDKVYFDSDGKLAWYDVGARKYGFAELGESVTIQGMAWVDQNKLAMLTRSSQVIIYDPASGQSTRTDLKYPAEPTPIHYICRGPDGRIYCGGYLSGGMGVYDPASGKQEQLGSLSQTESITVLGDRLYFGIYPHARLTWFDTTKPWNAKQDNPHEFDHLDRIEQDRPMGAVAVPSLSKVFYGTVPDYGKLGGVLAVVEEATDKVETFRNIIPDQSIVSLVYADNVIVGSSAIAGGLGIEAKAKEGKLFLWDPAQNKIIFETTPVPGATLIDGLVVGPQDIVWGIGDGTIFAFDVKARKVTFTKKLFDVDLKARHAGWRDATLALHPDGQIYGTADNKLFRFDPATKDVTVLRDKDSTLMAIDRQGQVYFAEMGHLWQYKP